jgi:hypothetical protein
VSSWQDRDGLSPVLEHATSWFTYQASQRIQSFNFFVVFQGALIVAVFQIWGNWSATAPLSAVGAVIALAFYTLEVRNTELVNHGRNAIAAVISAWQSGGTPVSPKFFPGKAEDARDAQDRRWSPFPGGTPPRLVTHTFVLRSLILISGAVWLLLLGASLGVLAK